MRLDAKQKIERGIRFVCKRRFFVLQRRIMTNFYVIAFLLLQPFRILLKYHQFQYR
jgi:hypothetical protein